MLDGLHRVLNPGGKVVLAAEPILESFHIPWGLRIDGESLWAIRTNGWLELGFQESYFIETCLRTGWSVQKHVTDVTPLGTVFVLTSLRGRPVQPGLVTMPSKDEQGWAIPDGPGAGQRYSLERSRLVVETNRPAGNLVIDLVNPAPHDLKVRINGSNEWESTVQGGQTAEATLPYDPDSGEVHIGAPLWVPAQAIAGSARPAPTGNRRSLSHCALTRSQQGWRERIGNQLRQPSALDQFDLFGGDAGDP